jgi:hypothetical protein
MASRSGNLFGLIFCVGLTLGLAGCAVTLYDWPAVAQKLNGEANYPPLKASEVYFFLSKEAFPPDLQWAQVCTLLPPQRCEWSDKKLISEFQAKAAEYGANAVIFDEVNTVKTEFGFFVYTGRATCYRLYKQDPSEDVDLSGSQYGTQDPNLKEVK